MRAMTPADEDVVVYTRTKMTDEEQVHDDKIVSNVTHMQAKADEAVTSLREQLAKLHAIALNAVAGAGGIAASEAELYSELSKEKLARADLQAQLDRMKAEYDKCPGLIASLRKQIKETREALDQDDDAIEQTRSKVVADAVQLEKKVLERVKETGGGSGRVRLGAGAPGSLQLPLSSEATRDEEAVVEDKKLEAGTVSGIAKLRKELAEMRKAHEACTSELKAKDAEIADLRKKIAEVQKQGSSLDELAASLRKQIAALELGRDYAKGEVEDLKKQLADLQRLYAPCPHTIAMLQSELAAFKANFDKDEQALAEDKKVFASKDAKIEDLADQISGLKKQIDALMTENKRLQQELDDARREYAPCAELIASLRKQIATLEDIIEALKKKIADMDEQIQRSQQQLEKKERVRLGTAAPAPAPAPPKICGVGMLLQAHEVGMPSG